MNIGIVSARYAHALLEYAKEEHVEEEIYESMFHLIVAISQVKEFMPVLQNPSLSAHEKENLICDAVNNSSRQFRQFARLVVRQGREEYLLYIAHSYISLYRKYKDIIAVKFTTAVPLSHALAQRVEQLIKSQGHKIVEMENIVDSSIIGGFILEANSERLDASLSSALNKIENEIVDNNRRLV